jgi:CDP-paratose 2-epimerase
MAAQVSGKSQIWEYVDNNREGDHICYISDLTKCRAHYPAWDITVPLPKVFEEIYQSWAERPGSRDRRPR